MTAIARPISTASMTLRRPRAAWVGASRWVTRSRQPDTVSANGSSTAAVMVGAAPTTAGG
jgi:hypothetical protein